MAWNLTTAMVLIPLLFLLTGLAITVLIDPYLSRKRRGVMLVILALSVSLAAQNVIEDYLAAGALRWFWRTALSVYGYTVRPVFLILFLSILRPEKKFLACWGLVVLNWAIHMTAFFSHICFWIDEKNHYRGGPLQNACLVISVLLLVYLLFESARDYRTYGKRDLLIPALVVLMILASVFLDGKVGLAGQPITFLTFAVVISSIFYYIWLHLRFVRDHEDDRMAQERIQIMLSQIQPHFLYNTLATIQSLCLVDPERASDVLEKFATYLRQNLDSLDQPSLISLNRELEHVRIYAEIEMIRFPNVQVVYDIRDKDFKLPALTVQPIVENAIRHGVRGRKTGLVTVITFLEGGNHFVVIRDNGKGFDVGEVKEDQRSHIGLKNVRERVEQMCGGSVSVESKKGKGTTVTIRIPVGVMES